MKDPIKPIYIFFSHPMNDVSYDKLVERREFFLDYICSLLLFKCRFSEEQVDRIQLIDNLNHEELDADAGRLMHLGRSIQQMQGADCVIFDIDYFRSKGGVVEETVCETYKIPHIYISNIDAENAFEHDLFSWFKDYLDNENTHKCQS